MQNLIGGPHFEIVNRYGYREDLIDRVATRKEAVELKQMYDASGMYAQIVIRSREF
jgi:hypothetical protein